VSYEGREVGQVTDAVWSPGLQANIGYVWVPIDLAPHGTALDVDSEHGHMTGSTAAVPFVDPNKQRPAQSLRGTVA
jgi:aminomethyltransferase